MSKIKAIIFDHDGVIADSENIHIQAERAIFDKYGFKVSEKEHKKVKGLTIKDIFLPILKKYKQENKLQELIKEKRIIWFNIARKELKIFEGFYELIDRLKTKYRLAMTTSGSLETINFVKTLFPKLKGIFELEVTADDVKKGKPDPEPYILTAKKLNLSPSECIVIEDSLNGIKSAKSAGMKVIAITNTYPKKEIEKEKPDLIVNSLNEITLETIESL
jgi:HAD superfamily hydrolase (TIGR01509 family)